MRKRLEFSNNYPRVHALESDDVHGSGPQIRNLPLLHELNQTFQHLEQTFAGTELAQRILFRSTWGSLDKCRNLTDPLTRDQAEAALLEQVKARRDKYEWGKIAHQNALAHGMAKAFAIPFWDVYPATLMRPAGHRKQDCGHFCLPGPPDELTRELLAYMAEL